MIAEFEVLLERLLLAAHIEQSDRVERGGARSRRVKAEGLNKDICVRAHENVRLQYDMYPYSFNMTVAEEPPTESALFWTLKVITLPELIVGKRHLGRVLYGRLCVVPFMVSSILTVLEDAAGRGVRLAIYNSLSSTASSREIKARFPLGMRVAIKEPFLKIAADTKGVIRIDNPADILLNETFEEGNLPTLSRDANISEELETIRVEGNQLFGEQDWLGAVKMYSQCVNLFIQEIDTKTILTRSNTLNRVVMLAYSNRAEARLRLLFYDDAFSDADKALEFDPKHVKTLVRKGKAAHGLALYEEACQVFKVALELSPAEQSILTILRASETANKQVRTGNYELSDYISGGFSGDAPFCADFVGPVEVRRVRYGYGKRGLFATRSVEPGIILVVSNPLAIVKGMSGTDRVSVTLNLPGRDFAKGSVDHGIQQDLVGELANLITTSKRKTAQLYSLSSYGRHRMELPSMELFRPGSRWLPPAAEKMEVDVGLIRRIVKLNAFGSNEDNLRHVRMRMENNDQASIDSNLGVWHLPSFANHSCAPNCAPSYIGDAMFVRAFVDIAKGEELTIPYFDELYQTREIRRELTENWHFECQCKRCLLEDSLKAQLSKVTEGMSGLVEAAEAERRREGQTRRATKALARVADGVEKVILSGDLELQPKHKSWIRGAYFNAYLSKFQLAMEENDAQSRISSLGLVVDALTSICVTSKSLSLAANLLLEVEKKYFKHSELYRQTYEQVQGIYNITFGKLPNFSLDTLIRCHEKRLDS